MKLDRNLLLAQEVGYLEGYSFAWEEHRKQAYKLVQMEGALDFPKILQPDGTLCSCISCWESLQDFMIKVNRICAILEEQRLFMLEIFKKAGIEL